MSDSLLELFSGERQVAPSTTGIRQDHKSRYEWVAKREREKRVIDAACGVGYGSQILADHGAEVYSFDVSAAAIDFARQHYGNNPFIEYVEGNAYSVDLPEADVVCAFEILEHLASPDVVLRRWTQVASKLYVSVPNEEEFAYSGKIRFHMRHYTKDQLSSLLRENGWEPVEWWGQKDKDSDLEEGVSGRTIVAACERIAVTPVKPDVDPEDELVEHLLVPNKKPKSVAIIAMGTSSRSWPARAAQHGGRWGVADETWVINNLGGVLAHDRVFHMDDLAIQEARAEAKESSAIAGMLRWMPHHPHVYTSRVYRDRYPFAREYPLEWVLNRTNVSPYFSGTLSYAVAFAIALGSIERIHMYGADFHYENAAKREQGRACVEFWLGVAEARGITVDVPADTTLFDSRWGGRDQLYGYDTEWVRVEYADRFRVSRVARRPEDVPTAEEMAARYSHNPKIDGR